MLFRIAFLAALVAGSHAADLKSLPDLLKKISATSYPDLEQISRNIWAHPEQARGEFFAHDQVVDYFKSKKISDGWTVTPHAYGMETSWQLDFEYRPPATPPTAEIPVIGIMAEYDALPNGHACGHNHIALNSLALASLVREAAIELGLPVKIRVVGCPDEEINAGKEQLLRAGAFDDVVFWIFAHPGNASGAVAMHARINVLGTFKRDSHFEAVASAYEAMLRLKDLNSAGSFPGNQTTADPIEDTGFWACNVVEDRLSFGITGSSVAEVNQTVESIISDGTYPNITCFTNVDNDMKNGVNLTCTGLGGHASENTQGPLVASVETYRSLSAKDGVQFYLPGNTSVTELDITWDIRTRYTTDVDAAANSVIAAIKDIASTTSTDIMYPSFELTPYLGQMLGDIYATADYGSKTDWTLGGSVPSSTDASWPQGAVLDPTTKDFIKADRVVFQSFWSLCDPAGLCAFPHDDLYRDVAGTDFSYSVTEINSRAQAHLVMELLNDPSLMANVTAIARA